MYMYRQDFIACLLDVTFANLYIRHTWMWLNKEVDWIISTQ